jgi:hypothetical protein
MLITHRAIEPALRYFVAGSLEMHISELLVDIALRPHRY